MKNYLAFIFVLIAFTFFSCSSKEIIVEENEYVFDADSSDLSVTISNELVDDVSNLSSNSETYYLVQIGAFTTEKRAKSFAEKARKFLNEELIVSFSDKVNLFVVQIEKKFYKKSEAEIVRDNLKLFPEYQDAWIVSINK